MALLEVHGLHAGYGPTAVLHGVDLEVQDGGISTLLGANGAGKTTTLRAVCGMLRGRGQIRFAGRDLSRMATEDIVRTGIAHVPEGRGTFNRLSVHDNLRLAALTRRDRRAVQHDLERVYASFPRLRERHTQQAGTLSGGEQQMLAIGRALMLRPRLMLLDEPSFGLAPLVTRDIFAILREVNRSDGVSMLLVEQNAGRALELAGHAYLLETGRVVRAGSAAAMQADEAVRRSYLGY